MKTKSKEIKTVKKQEMERDLQNGIQSLEIRINLTED